MIKLYQKMIRDMWRQKSQFLSIIIMCFLGMLIYSGIERVWNGMDIQKQQYFEDTNMADFWVNGYDFLEEQVEEICKLQEVTEVQCAVIIDGILEYKEQSDIRLILYKDDNISMPKIIDGNKELFGAKGIWITKEYADKSGACIGDIVNLKYGENKVEATIQGILYSPEYISYTVSTTSMLPNHLRSTFGYIDEDTMQQLCGKISYNQLKLKISENTDEVALKKQISNILGARYISALNRSEWVGISNYESKVEQIKKMSIMFSFVFILLALLTILTTMKRIVNQQRIQIGTIKALGFYDWQIKFHYILYGLLPSSLGVIIGIIVAPFTITPVLMDLQKQFYSMPNWEGHNSIYSYGVAIIIILVCTVVVYFSCKNIVKELPSKLLRSENPSRGKQTLLEKVSALWNSMSFEWRWSLRDMLQHKVRTGIAIVGVMGSMMLLISSFGLRDTINYVNTYLYGTQYSYNEKWQLEGYLSEENRHNIEEKLDGDCQWIVESLAEVKNAKNTKIENVIVVDEGYFITYRNNDDDSVISLPKEGCVITRQVADDMDVSENDILQLSTVTGRYNVKVEKVISVYTPQGIIFSKKAWENMGENFIPTALLVGENVKDADVVKELANVSSDTTLSRQKEDADEILENVRAIILLLLAAAIVLSVVILYNLGILSYSERSREYATLRVLGWYNKEIKKMIKKDTIVNVLVGLILGIPVGFAFLKLYVHTVSSTTIHYEPYLMVTSFGLAVAITTGCTLIVNYIVSKKIAHIDMVASLKSSNE